MISAYLICITIINALNSFAKPVEADKRAACESATGDAPFTLSCAELASTVSFPDGFHDRDGGIVFLVHGTFTSSEASFGLGPYRTLLPYEGPGYDIAWFNSPTRTLEDAQTTAEYIAYNVPLLARQSKTGKVFIIGHSMGNNNIQWALTFYHSIRTVTSGFISLAGDFHGTAEGPLSCAIGTLIRGGCWPSVIQQTVGSHYLAAQNEIGGAALVPTTSIYSLTDEIIQPEIVNPTSALSGSALIAVQHACPVNMVEHAVMLVTAPAYFLTIDALAHGGKADLTRFDRLSMCSYLSRSSRSDPFAEVPRTIQRGIVDTSSILTGATVNSEPLLRSYVCEKGAASSYCL